MNVVCPRLAMVKIKKEGKRIPVEDEFHFIGKITGSENDIRTLTSEDPVVYKDTLEKENIVDFEDKEDAKKIELVCSPVKFSSMGTKGLKDTLETYLDDDINVELAFYSHYQCYPNHYWNKHY